MLGVGGITNLPTKQNSKSTPYILGQRKLPQPSTPSDSSVAALKAKPEITGCTQCSFAYKATNRKENVRTEERGQGI
jgi:hypothetical protein